MSFWKKGVNFAYFNQIKTCESQIVMHLDLYEYIRVFILKCTESNLCWFVKIDIQQLCIYVHTSKFQHMFLWVQYM